MHEIHCQVQVLKKDLTDKKRLFRIESATNDINNPSSRVHTERDVLLYYKSVKIYHESKI